MEFKSALMRGAGVFVLLFVVCSSGAYAQFNSGSDGHDGALNPTANTVIDMADHPDGIYQYTSVNIPSGVTVSFTPNAANTPVVWLIQGDCIVAGPIDVSGKAGTGTTGAAGGPGGWKGGDKYSSGRGPGAGGSQACASYATAGSTMGVGTCGQSEPGPLYGNEYLVPLLGGSGGGGGLTSGGGGGGAILIAVSGTLTINASVSAAGGYGYSGSCYDPGYAWYNTSSSGHGSGGAVRLMASSIVGGGSIYCSSSVSATGLGRISIEAYSDLYTGSLTGSARRGMQNIILLPASLDPHLRVSSIGGVPVPATPLGSLPAADVLLPGSLASPFSVGVECHNIPLNTPVTISVKPQQGATISAVATNSSGTFESSTASTSFDIPVGGGTISAQAVITIATGKSLGKMSYRDTGLTTTGERFAVAEITSILGGQQQMTFITESGKRVSFGAGM